MESDKPERPKSLKRLNQLIERETDRRLGDVRNNTLRKNFITAVLGQMMPNGAYLKGGASIGLRYPLQEARSSRDVDTAFTGSKESFEQALKEKLKSGWQGFTGTVEPDKERKNLPKGGDFSVCVSLCVANHSICYTEYVHIKLKEEQSCAAKQTSFPRQNQRRKDAHNALDAGCRQIIYRGLQSRENRQSG